MNRIQSALEAWREAERRLIQAKDPKLVPRLARRLELARDAYRRAVNAEDRGTPSGTDMGGETPASTMKGAMR